VCPAGSLCIDPMLTNQSLGAGFNSIPLAASPAIDAAATSVSTVPVDSRNLPRPGPGSLGYDIGATQYQGLCDDLVFRADFDFAADTVFVDGFDGGALLPQACVPTRPFASPVIPPH